MNTQTDIRPATLELAQLLFLENIAFARRQGVQMLGSWSDQHPNTRSQFLALAECSRQWAALDRVPPEAIDLPVPVPPLRDRLRARAEAAILDRAAWIWILAAFVLGRLL